MIHLTHITDDGARRSFLIHPDAVRRVWTASPEDRARGIRCFIKTEDDIDIGIEEGIPYVKHCAGMGRKDSR